MLFRSLASINAGVTQAIRQMSLSQLSQLQAQQRALEHQLLMQHARAMTTTPSAATSPVLGPQSIESAFAGGRGSARALPSLGSVAVTPGTASSKRRSRIKAGTARKRMRDDDEDEDSAAASTAADDGSSGAGAGAGASAGGDLLVTINQAHGGPPISSGDGDGSGSAIDQQSAANRVSVPDPQVLQEAGMLQPSLFFPHALPADLFRYDMFQPQQPAECPDCGLRDCADLTHHHQQQIQQQQHVRFSLEQQARQLAAQDASVPLGLVLSGSAAVNNSKEGYSVGEGGSYVAGGSIEGSVATDSRFSRSPVPRAPTVDRDELLAASPAAGAASRPSRLDTLSRCLVSGLDRVVQPKPVLRSLREMPANIDRCSSAQLHTLRNMARARLIALVALGHIALGITVSVLLARCCGFNGDEVLPIVFTVLAPVPVLFAASWVNCEERLPHIDHAAWGTVLLQAIVVAFLGLCAGLTTPHFLLALLSLPVLAGALDLSIGIATAMSVLLVLASFTMDKTDTFALAPPAEDLPTYAVTIAAGLALVQWRLLSIDRDTAHQRLQRVKRLEEEVTRKVQIDRDSKVRRKNQLEALFRSVRQRFRGRVLTRSIRKLQRCQRHTVAGRAEPRSRAQHDPEESARRQGGP